MFLGGEMELDAGWCNVCHRDNSRAGGGGGQV